MTVVLIGALAVFTSCTFLSYFLALRAIYEVALEIALAFVAQVLLVSDVNARNYVVGALAIAGLAHIVNSAFRLVQAWADRTEAANLQGLLPPGRGRR